MAEKEFQRDEVAFAQENVAERTEKHHQTDQAVEDKWFNGPPSGVSNDPEGVLCKHSGSKRVFPGRREEFKQKNFWRGGTA